MNPLIDKAGVCRVCEGQPCSCGSLVAKLRKLHDKAERGVNYGFEQTIWRDAADEINRLHARCFDLRNSLRDLIEANDDYINGDAGFPFADALEKAKAFLGGDASTDPERLAAEDAANYGSGFVRIMPDGRREHVPHHDVFIEPVIPDQSTEPQE